MNDLTNPAEIRALLDRHGFHFSKALGQNFLIEREVPIRIASAASGVDGGEEETGGVLEIGPGIGCLTVQLAERFARVVSIERDRTLLPVLEETLADCGNVEIVPGDAMKLDLRALAEEKLPVGPKVFCANLPYNITTPVLTAVIEAGCFSRICVMIQKEVAQRLCASPGGKDYGAFGLFVQWYYEPQLLFSVPPHCFMPAPKVTSAVVLMTRRQSPPAPVKDEEMLFRIIRAAFNQRRKTLVNALAAAFPEFGKQGCEEALAACGFDSTIRGERLSLMDFAALSDAVTERVT